MLLRLFAGFALTYVVSLLVCILSGPDFIRGPDFKLEPVPIYYRALDLSSLLQFVFVPFSLWAGSLLQGGERREKILVLLFIAVWIGISLWYWNVEGKDLQYEVNGRYTEDLSTQGRILDTGLVGFVISFFLIFVPWFTYKLWRRIKR